MSGELQIRNDWPGGGEVLGHRALWERERRFRQLTQIVVVVALEFLGGGALVDLYAMSWVRDVLQLLEGAQTTGDYARFE